MARDSAAMVVKAVDQNGNGEIDIEDIIILSVKTPGVKINRDNFLKKELSSKYPQDVVDKAIATNPAQAGIKVEEIDKIADAVIKFERNMVSGISTALGVPGGWAMVATIPADLAQYYGYTLRAAQKLMYLYGFPQIIPADEGEEMPLDSATMNELIVCLGIMYGVAGANNAIKAIAKALGTGVEKQLMKKALTKGTIYPLVKNIAKWFGINMTKKVFSGFFGKAIPVAGGVISGGVTFLSFMPCCKRLKLALKDTQLSNLAHVSSKEEDDIVQMIMGDDTYDFEPDDSVVVLEDVEVEEEE